MGEVDRVDSGGLDKTKHLLVVLDMLCNVARTHCPFLQQGGRGQARVRKVQCAHL